MLPDNNYLNILEHGKNLGKKEVVEQIQEGLLRLQNTKGFGPKRLQQVYEALQIEWRDESE